MYGNVYGDSLLGTGCFFTVCFKKKLNEWEFGEVA
jgi:hypothetical protein